MPIVNRDKLGKSWAAGRAIGYIWEKKLGKTIVLEEVISRTIAAGDGLADFDFTVPTFLPELQSELRSGTSIPIIFVGTDENLPQPGTARYAYRENIIIEPTGQGNVIFVPGKAVIQLEPVKGAGMVSAVLDFLHMWGYTQHF